MLGLSIKTDSVLQVSEITYLIKNHLESRFSYVAVEGEVSGITYHGSGHVYFSIKDDECVLSCVFFKSNASKSKITLENGQKIIAKGHIQVYPPRGTYSLNVIECAYSGAGDLKAKYDRLKQELSKKGYFDKKGILPKYPKRIVFLTSKTGAALQDMIKVASNRYCLCEFILIDTLMQGNSAKYSIAENLRYADGLNADIIVLARGGGSVEDLWVFNEIEVLDAIYESKTLVVSAIGHEIDEVLSDRVADVRAPTPSAAMEMILCDKYNLLDELAFKLDSLQSCMMRILNRKQQELTLMERMIDAYNAKYRILALKRKNLDRLDRLHNAMRRYIDNKRLILNKYQLELPRFNPELVAQSHRHILLRDKDRLRSMYKSMIDNKKRALESIPSILNRDMLNFLQQKRLHLMQMRQVLEKLNPANKFNDGLVEILKDNKKIKISDLARGDRVELIDNSGSVTAIIE